MSRGHDTTNYNNQKKFATKQGKDLVVTLRNGEVIGRYTLKRISPEKIHFLRSSNKTFCLLKDNGNYAITQIPNNLNLVNCMGTHLCTSCEHLYERTISPTACAKVYDASTQEKLCGALENYDFISKGLETFGCLGEAFIVMGCKKYKRVSDTKSDSPQNRKIDLLSHYSVFKHNNPGVSWQDYLSLIQA